MARCTGGSAAVFFIANPVGRLGKGGVKGAPALALRGGKNCLPNELDGLLLCDPGLSNIGGGVLPSTDGVARLPGLSSASRCKDGFVVDGWIFCQGYGCCGRNHILGWCLGEN